MSARDAAANILAKAGTPNSISPIFHAPQAELVADDVESRALIGSVSTDTMVGDFYSITDQSPQGLG